MVGMKIKSFGIVHEYRSNRASAHEWKSDAGHLFQKPEIESVCVFDDKGMLLYLRKDENGKCIVREERK